MKKKKKQIQYAETQALWKKHLKHMTKKISSSASEYNSHFVLILLYIGALISYWYISSVSFLFTTPLLLDKGCM